MLLALDVGNTNITLGVFKEEELIFVSRMATDVMRMEDQYATEIRDIIKLYNIDEKKISGAIISSVVPKLTGYIAKAIKKVFSLTAMVVTADLEHGLAVKNGSVSNLGADIIVGCAAAKKMYSYPNVVIDMGTATTLFVTDRDGYILGGSIIPGMGISLDALTSRAAQLASISLEAPEKVVGTTTETCIQSGMIYGTAAMIDGLIMRMEEELGYKCTIVATGGLASTIINHCRHDIVISDTLLLEGLKIIYDKNK